ncbi:hypothetical protein FRB90_008395, partial [Tulasnella sp. 427]
MVFGSVQSGLRPGTRRTPWSPQWEPTHVVEPSGAIVMQAITAMPAYSTSSFEEHRLADISMSNDSVGPSSSGFGASGFSVPTSTQGPIAPSLFATTNNGATGIFENTHPLIK